MIKRLAVAVSGMGSILEAMVEHKLPIDLVLADRPCRGLKIASDAGIPTILHARPIRKLTDGERENYTLGAVRTFERLNIDLIAMSGFMTIFSPVFFDHFPHSLINIHPSLLPSFKGDHAVRDALAAGVKITGTTIHYATAELDAGPIIAQEAVRILPDDTEQTLHERIKIVERSLYPQVISQLLAS